MDTRYIVFLIDGECSFCNQLIVWILNRRQDDNIRFFPLQSRSSIDFLTSVGVVDGQSMNSSYLVSDKGVFRKSRALFELTAYLKGTASLLRYFGYFPESITDFFYDLIARHRYQIFGKESSVCDFAHRHYAKYLLSEHEASTFFKKMRSLYDSEQQA